MYQLRFWPPLQRHSYSPISGWWHRVFYLNIRVSHLSCVSNSQHYLQGLHRVSNSLAKSICEVSDTVYLHPLTNKLHLWYWLPQKHNSCDNILQFVTDVVQRMGVFGNQLQYAKPILSNIPSPCITPSMCFEPLSFSLLSCCFQGICDQVFQIYSNRKLTESHIQQKCYPFHSTLASVHLASKCSDKTEFQTTTWYLQTKAPVRNCAFVLR